MTTTTTIEVTNLTIPSDSIPAEVTSPDRYADAELVINGAPASVTLYNDPAHGWTQTFAPSLDAWLDFGGDVDAQMIDDIVTAVSSAIKASA